MRWGDLQRAGKFGTLGRIDRAQQMRRPHQNFHHASRGDSLTVSTGFLR
jgi:hypothetical protein